MDWNRLFPFVNGQMLTFEGGENWYPDVVVEHRTLDQARYVGKLRYLQYSRGRSSAMLVFTDGTMQPKAYEAWREEDRLRRFYFFMTDAHDLIPLLVKGEMEGSFIPSKRGQNFGWLLEKQD